MHITLLPNEVLLSIGEWLPVPSFNSFSQSAKILHQLLHNELYTRAQTYVNGYGISPLEWAATKGRISTLVKLLDRTPPKDLQGNHAFAALYAAVVSEHVGLVQLLLTTGVKASPPRRYRESHAYGWTPLHHVSDRGNQEIVQLLLQFGAKPNIVRFGRMHSYAAIHLAAREGHSAVVKLLLESGAIHTNFRWKSPLHWAAFRGHTRCAVLLIEHGADVNVLTGGRVTPLHDAAQCGRSGASETVELLLRFGASAQAANIDGETPLHRCYSVNIARLLLDHGADISAIDRHGNTPLHTLAIYGRVEVMQFLLSRGAEVNLRNSNGQTAWDILRSDPEFDDVRELLEEGGSDLRVARGGESR
jgi:ankyrin repeat protein